MKKSLTDDPEMLDLRELIVYPNPDEKGTYVVIGGNMRYNAAKELGLSELPCKILPESTPVEKMRSFIIKDNIAYGEWDMDLLSEEWDTEELSDWGVDLPIMESEINPDEFGCDFSLPSGDKAPYQQMTFTFANEQAERIRGAIGEIKQTDAYKYAETFGNENSNGNALYQIVKQWEEQRK